MEFAWSYSKLPPQRYQLSLIKICLITQCTFFSCFWPIMPATQSLSTVWNSYGLTIKGQQWLQNTKVTELKCKHVWRIPVLSITAPPAPRQVSWLTVVISEICAGKYLKYLCDDQQTAVDQHRLTSSSMMWPGNDYVMNEPIKEQGRSWVEMCRGNSK